MLFRFGELRKRGGLVNMESHERGFRVDDSLTKIGVVLDLIVCLVWVFAPRKIPTPLQTD